jgi:hypothetical protein
VEGRQALNDTAPSGSARRISCVTTLGLAPRQTFDGYDAKVGDGHKKSRAVVEPLLVLRLYHLELSPGVSQYETA